MPRPGISLAVVLLLVASSSHYYYTSATLSSIITCVGPRVFSPDSSYQLRVFLEGNPTTGGSSSEPVRLSATINSFNETFGGDDTVIAPGSSTIISVKIPPTLKESKYNLTVRAKDADGVVQFENKTTLFPAVRRDTVLVQTDKPVYKPGELVQFRVILLDAQLLPLETDKVTLGVRVTDSAGNVIKIWDGVSPNIPGLFKGELQLSDEPVLGQWRISVGVQKKISSVPDTSGVSGPEADAEGQQRLIAPIPDDFGGEEEDTGVRRADLTFGVEKYVLPKFEVKVLLPPFITFADTKVPVKIDAKYTYGKGVKGTVSLVGKFPYYYGSNEVRLSRSFGIVDGAGTTELDVKELFEGGTLYERSIRFEASVVEDVTGIVRNGTGEIQLYEFPYKIESVEQSGNVKPGLPFTVQFRVLTQDNKPISDPSPDALQVSHGFSYLKEGGTFNTSIPADGVVSLKFSTPTNELIQVSRIELKYKALTKSFYVPPKFNSDTDAYIQITAGEESLVEGQPFTVTVNVTKAISSLNYVMSDGRDVLGSGKENFAVAVEPSAGGTILELQCPTGASPEMRLTVFTVLGDRIVADWVKLKVEPGTARSNFLNVTSGAEEGEPGSNLTLQLTSTKGSLVALRGVDQSVLLLGSEDTDVTQGRLNQEVENSKSQDTWRYRIWGGSSTFQLFQDAGLTILTNAALNIPTSSTPWYAQKVSDNTAVEFALPMAAPVRVAALGGAAGGAALSANSDIRVRTFFPETWLWEEVKLDNDSSTALLTKTLPDTLTSWVITGFSLNSVTGIGILPVGAKVRTIRPFFLSLNLPYSVVKGEVLVLQVLVHNYLDAEVSAEITLDNAAGEFRFVASAGNDTKSVGTRVLSVKSNTVTSVEFPIAPLKFGQVMLSAKGVTAVAGDALTQPLRVKPPGQRFRRSEAVLLNPAENSSSVELSPTFPEGRVQGADSLMVTIIADMLGPTVKNLDKLIQMPTGCGEQNLMQFVVDIVILEYLQATKSISDAVEKKALRFLETGYQRELTYRHGDGSYSAFGTSDPAGSTWLTAFVIRCFLAAKPYIFIEDRIIEEGLTFLTSQQFDSGAFFESGKVIHSDIQGGSTSTGVALTAYAVITLIEANRTRKSGVEGGLNNNLSEPIAKGLEFIVNKTSDSGNDPKDPYALVITTYLLHLAQHSAKDDYFRRLEGVATEENGLKFVTLPKPTLNESEPKANGTLEPWHRPPDTKPISVEMTGYVLLTYMLRGEAPAALPIVRWLLKQRNPNGGFISTQDTNVGLSALAKYAQLTKSPVTDLKVEIDDGREKRSVTITNDNAEVLNQFELSPDTKTVSIAASGTGTTLASLDWIYYVESTEEKPAFSVDLKPSGESGQLSLLTCVTYLGDKESNMAIAEVNFPSGYTLDQDSLGSLKDVPRFKRSDVEDGETKVSLYFDSFISDNSTCFTLRANRDFKVGKQAAAYVSVYDYYDTTKRATAYYDPPKVSICDICEANDDCDMNNCI